MIRYILVLLISIISLPVYSQTHLEMTYVIKNIHGGSINNFVRKALILESTKTLVKFDGNCYSACTVFIGDVFDFDKCMTPRAIFGFHKPYLLGGHNTAQDYINRDELVTALWNSYPVIVREFLRKNGWPSVDEGADPGMLTYMTAKDLEGVIPYCE